MITKATLEPVLKEIYKGVPTTLYYQNFPFYALLAKKGDLGGRLNAIPMRLANGQGRSKQLATAQANETAEEYRRWEIKSSQDYAYASITRKSMKEAQNDAQAFVKSVTELINGRIWSLTESIAVDLYRDGTGNRAAIASVSAANPAQVTLANAEDSTNFDVNQTLQARDPSGTLRTWDGANSNALVTAIDRINGVLTLGGIDNSGAGATAVAGDGLYVEGDFVANGATSGLSFKGLQAWIPESVSPGENFFGVDRSADRTRLAGIFYDGSAGTLEEALVTCGRLVKRESNMTPDLILMHDDKVAQLILELGSKVERVERKVGEFSFGTVMIHLNGGSVEVLSDRNCPVDEAYMLKLDSWGLHHAPGELIELVDEDGHMLSRTSGDAFELRAACYHQLVCYNPCANGRARLPAS